MGLPDWTNLASHSVLENKFGMVGTTGIEPVTPSMSTKCSPAELRAPIPLKRNPYHKDAETARAVLRLGQLILQSDTYVIVSLVKLLRI